MKFRKTIFIILIVIGSIAFYGTTNDYYFKLNKSFDIFASVFKTLTNNYVLDVDPEILLKHGIDGMLSSLDPYTVYYDDSDDSDLELMTDGTYVGFGFSVQVIDSIPYIYDISEGFAADEHGMLIGDVIYSIDTNIIFKKNDSSLRKFTRGVSGDKAKFTLLRNNFRDTVRLAIPRQQITIKDVSHTDLLAGGIGYIKLERFSKNSSRSLRKSIEELSSKDSLKGLIIDLRGNPGGLLESAVSISEMFVPKNSKIVSTKGKNASHSYQYKSNVEPAYPDLPLTILIDSRSASASEILAGALQDLDRAVIIGERSFGKGLVQTIRNLPYDASMKITTSKYYTPSGRCIQRIAFAEEYGKKRVAEQIDSTKFFTSNGREVLESAGIAPDINVTESHFDNTTKQFASTFQIYLYVNTLDSNMMNNEDADIEYEGFKSFAKAKEFYKIDAAIQATDYIKEIIESESDNNISKENENSVYESKVNTKVEELKKLIVEHKLRQMDSRKKSILNLIKIEKLRRKNQDSAYTLLLENDVNITTALKVLRNGESSTILSGINTDNSNN